MTSAACRDDRRYLGKRFRPDRFDALCLMLKDFLDEIVKARAARLEAGEGSADEKLETVVGRLFDPEP